MITILLHLSVAEAKVLVTDYTDLPIHKAVIAGWKPSGPKSNQRILVDCLLDSEGDIAKVLSRYPGAVTARAWKRNGLQLGMSRINTGTIKQPRWERRGNSKYRGMSKLKLRSYLSKSLTYRNGGATPETVVRTQLSDIGGHRWAGWGERDYTS